MVSQVQVEGGGKCEGPNLSGPLGGDDMDAIDWARFIAPSLRGPTPLLTAPAPPPAPPETATEWLRFIVVEDGGGAAAAEVGG